jgi:deoxyadenosine/deoxycytidine kinase
MDMQALLIFQIIADVVLCIAILFLLTRIGRNIGQARSPLLEEKYLAELGKLIQESHAEAEHFSRIMDESCIKFKDLAIHLEAQEAKLAERLREVNRQLEKAPPSDSTHDHDADTKYGNIIALLKTGMTVKETAQQSGLTEGEVSLIFELEKKKTES